ncbi:Methionine--tRNA ligase [uncultured archaeon]|nr:Methionine--tRNA ligase [uncultured archaeon]
MVAYEEFAKMDLRVARVLEANAVEGSNKLMKLVVDIGTEKRQIIAGIAKYYKPEELAGKNIIIIANMDYRKLAGLESQGMLLAAGESEIVLLTTEKDIAPGTKIG